MYENIGQERTHFFKAFDSVLDERALVQGAQQFGYVFDTRTPTYVEVATLSGRERYEILNVIDFTSSRKRMSVIVRTSKSTILLLCKVKYNPSCSCVGSEMRSRNTYTIFSFAGRR